MLTTQLLDAGANGFLAPVGFGGFGAAMSSPAIKSLQTYLVNLKKLPAAKADGVMNDATMAVIFDMFVATSDVASKLPLLDKVPDLKSGITKVIKALKDADTEIKNVTFGFASLSTVISQFTTITAVVRASVNAISGGAGDTAANAMLKVRDTIFNAIGGQADLIQKAFQIFFPAAAGTPGATTGTTSGGRRLTHISTDVMQNLTTVSLVKAPTKAGTIYAFSKKLGKYRVAVPKAAVTAPGLGIAQDGALGGECIFGDCGGLGQDASATFTETAPSATVPPAPARQVTESELEKLTGTTPFYKKPLFWIATVGGVAAVGGGYWYVRRRRVAPAARTA